MEEPGATLTVTLTTLSGDADLFVSSYWKHPTIVTNLTVASFNAGDVLDRVVLSPALEGSYYIGVFGVTNSSFTINAHATTSGTDTHDAMVALVMGQPQVGYVETGGWAYFQFVTGDHELNLTVTATPLTGSIGMYINQCLENADRCDGRNGGEDRRPRTYPPYFLPGGELSSDTSISRESIQISKGNPYWCTRCSYVVGIYGHTESNFTVAVASTNHVLRLQLSVPHRDYVNAEEHRYFTFTLTEPHQDVIISLTSFTGDADLFVTACGVIWPHTSNAATCNMKPTNRSATWAAMTYGSETLVIPYGSPKSCVPSESNPCRYYIAVYGFTASSFSIMASLHSDVPVVLVSGVPQAGHVNASVENIYQLDAPRGHSLINIVVTPAYGDPDMYVTLDGVKPGPTHWDYASASDAGDDTITIRSTDRQYQRSCHPDERCRVLIGVRGFRASDYTIVATTGATTTTLQTGSPLRGFVAAHMYSYYVFTATQPNQMITIVLTPISGDPDMYVSSGTNNTTPTALYGGSFWHATRLGSDVLEIFPDDPHFCDVPCNYYIGVRGFSDAAFTILARQGSAKPTLLLDGVPQLGQLNRSVTDQYVVNMPPHVSGMDIVLTPIAGDADLFVTLDGHTPSSHHAQYASMASMGRDAVTIHAYDPQFQKYCHGYEATCAVRIAVQGFTACEYSIVASTANQSTLLLENSPMTVALAADEYSFFVVHHAQADAALSIILTPISGDPDMFIDATNTRPTAESRHSFASLSTATDMVDIYPGQPGACEQIPCNYYIGITGFLGPTTFSLLARNHSGAALPLVDGRPQTGYVDAGGTVRYLAYLTAAQGALEVVITPLYGDPDVFISLGDGRLPTRAQADYASRYSWGQDLIDVNASDAAFRNHCGGDDGADGSARCAVNIAVFGFRASSYVITSTSGTGLTVLREDVPIRDHTPPHGYDYFVFTSQEAQQPLTFTLTPLSGSPNMYISWTTTRPDSNPANHSWSTETAFDDTITIDEGHLGCAGDVPCRYYVGVTGGDGGASPASFQLLVTLAANDAKVMLQPGMPQTGHVPPRPALAWYAFTIGPDREDLALLVTSLDNPVGVYVTQPPAAPPRWECVHVVNSATGPVCSEYAVVGAQWTSVASFSGETVRIPGDDSCTNCELLIAVASLDPGAVGADFSLVATVASGPVTLRDGVPQQDTVREGEYQYYRLEVERYHADVVITATSFFGDADLFVSTTVPRPNMTASGHTWASRAYQHDRVVLQFSDIADCEAAAANGVGTGACSVFIAVYGFANASYAITASVSDDFGRPTHLLAGVPQSGYVNESRYAYYQVLANAAPDSRLSVTVTPSFGDPDLYATTDNSQPGTRHYEFSSTHFGGWVEDVIWIVPDQPHYCNRCLINVAVFGYMESAYTITFQTSEGIARLVDSIPTRGEVSEASYKYYRFAVQDSAADVTFALTPLSGEDVRLFASVQSPTNPGSLPTRAVHQWAGAEYGGQVIIVPHTDPAACSDCSYLVGVTAPRNSSYFITATLTVGGTGRVMTLVDGQPLKNVVPALDYRYFLFIMKGNSYRSVTFRVRGEQCVCGVALCCFGTDVRPFPR